MVDSDVQTVKPEGADYRVPDYQQTPEIHGNLVPLTHVESGFRKALDIHSRARDNRSAYFHDTTLTTFFSDLTAWSANPDDIPKSMEPIINALNTRLTEDEIADLQQFFNINSAQLGDLLDQVDSIVGDIDTLPENEQQEYKLEQAKFNQKLATAFFHASRLDQNDPERKKMESFIAFMGSMGSETDVNSLNPYHEVINAALSQSALMNWLDSVGCYIIVPDYENDEEMLATDMKGVDFVAVTPDGDLLLIDAKGRFRDEDTNQVLTQPKVDRLPTDRTSRHPATELALEHLRDISNRETTERFKGIDAALNNKFVRDPQFRIDVPTSKDILGPGQFDVHFIMRQTQMLKKRLDIK